MATPDDSYSVATLIDQAASGAAISDADIRAVVDDERSARVARRFVDVIDRMRAAGGADAHKRVDACARDAKEAMAGVVGPASLRDA